MNKKILQFCTSAGFSLPLFGSGRNRKKIKKQFRAAAFLFICMLLFSSCQSRNNEGDGVRIQIDEQVTEDGCLIQIPSFISGDEEMVKNLGELEGEKKKLEKIRDRAIKRGERLEMLSSVLDVKGYPQVTVVWYVEENGIRHYDLATLCADEKNKLPVTCREALEKTGMSGVDLSLKVGKLSLSDDIQGRLSGTQMEGFLINESGEVEEIYMKLTLEVETEDKDHNKEKESPEEHFFSYNIREGSLERLSEKGFDIP